MNDALKNADHGQVALKLWIPATAKDDRASDLRSKDPGIASLNPRSASQLADMISGKSAELAKLGQASCEAWNEIGLDPDEATAGGRRIKMKELAERAKSACGTDSKDRVSIGYGKCTAQLQVEFEVRGSKLQIMGSF